jgi:ArsR family transcriptional regulator
MSTTSAAETRTGLPVAGTCCAPLLREPITASQAADLARLLKALADPTRLRLVSMVAAHEGGEACVCDLTEPLGLTQPTISHHLKILVDAGIFTRDKRGVWAYYALRPAALRALADVLGDPITALDTGRAAIS